MSNIKVLDCTLRDGGYVNMWQFGEKNIKKIIKNLVNAKLDYIECGFFKPIVYDSNKSLFSCFDDLENLLPSQTFNTKFTLMINFGESDIEKIPSCKNENICIRVVFKKQEKDQAIEYCKKLISKGYNVFVNPMHTNTYSPSELLDIVKKVNLIKPVGFTIVDTTGAMKEKDILTTFYVVDSELDKNIALCFHSHNNLQLSFSNAQCLMKVCHDRELVIDSTVFGMGRGAGNLCTELLTQYINDNYNGHYDIVPILKIVDEQINPIFAKTPWGYSVPYYLAATNHCHPNYAKYLVDKQTVAVEVINEILQLIPGDKKATYDEKFIKQLYLDKVTKSVDDTKVVEWITQALANKKILLLAPGKSLKLEDKKIKTFIKEKNPYIISLNFEPSSYKSDMTFISNPKRFMELPEKMYSTLVVTSNIQNVGTDAIILNYSTYLNSSKMYDNVALMLLNLFVKIGVSGVTIAGLDGFSKVASENYVSDELINTSRLNEFDERNKIMTEELQKLGKNIKIEFLTQTLYKI